MIEENLKSFLETITGKQVFADEKPLENNNCLVYRRISTRAYRTQTGRTDLEKIRFQINCYSTNKSGARNLAETVKAALDGNNTNFKTATLENDFDVKEIEKNLYYAILDFFVFK